ncbi:hypothetical protein HOO65_090110 [Ceratocystis lukuohia]|uniref:Uncharacterized protein n=1 Tax=Ceratocystis lukuohia TaxID=2019550 RepID=A0ABR4M965_9PEZI
MFVLGITIALEMSARHVYCRFAVVAALGLDTILWLVAWAWAASVASTFLNIRKWHNSDKYAIGLAVAASLAALTWMLMITITAGFILACIPTGSNAPSHAQPSSSYRSLVPFANGGEQQREEVVMDFHPSENQEQEIQFSPPGLNGSLDNQHDPRLHLRSPSPPHKSGYSPNMTTTNRSAAGTCAIPDSELTSPAGFINVFRLENRKKTDDSSSSDSNNSDDRSASPTSEDLDKLAQIEATQILAHSMSSNSSVVPFSSSSGSLGSQQWDINIDDSNTLAYSDGNLPREESPPAQNVLDEDFLPCNSVPPWSLTRLSFCAMSICEPSLGSAADSQSASSTSNSDANADINKEPRENSPGVLPHLDDNASPRYSYTHAARNAVKDAFSHLKSLVNIIPLQPPPSGPSETSTTAMRRALISAAVQRVGSRDEADVARISGETQVKGVTRYDDVSKPQEGDTEVEALSSNEDGDNDEDETADNLYESSPDINRPQPVHGAALNESSCEYRALQRRVIELELRVIIGELQIAHLGGQVDLFDQIDADILKEAVETGVNVLAMRREYLQSMHKDVLSPSSSQDKYCSDGDLDEVMADISDGGGELMNQAIQVEFSLARL